MPTNNDQVIKERKRNPPSKTIDEFTPEDWERYKRGPAVTESPLSILRKDLRLMNIRATEAVKKQPAMEGKQVQDYTK